MKKKKVDLSTASETSSHGRGATDESGAQASQGTQEGSRERQEPQGERRLHPNPQGKSLTHTSCTLLPISFGAGVRTSFVQEGREASEEERREGPDEVARARGRSHLWRHGGSGRQECRDRSASRHRRHHGSFGSASPLLSLASFLSFFLCSLNFCRARTGWKDDSDSIARSSLHQEHDGRHQRSRHDRIGSVFLFPSAREQGADFSLETVFKANTAA